MVDRYDDSYFFGERRMKFATPFTLLCAAIVPVRSILCRSLIALCGFVTAVPLVVASDLRAGSLCEAAWGDGYISALPPERTQQQRALAEKGDAQALFFMGVATADKAESNQWLQKAIAAGSIGAAAYYAYQRDTRLASQNDVEKWDQKDPRKPYTCWWPIDGLTEEDQTELLKPIIAAAEAGEPQPATWLWQMVVGETRIGGTYNRNCKTNHPLLKASDTRKWMELAGRGGNPWAQENLCQAYMGLIKTFPLRAPNPDWGFVPNDSNVFYWCSLAAQNACSKSSLVSLSHLYQYGIGTEKSSTQAAYWNDRSNKRFTSAQRAVQVTRQIAVQPQ